MSIIKRMLLGHAIGDALGVPVEFMDREHLRKDPVTDMRGFGTHRQPAGTWSDDTSMTLALMDSMVKSNGVDADDIMKRFVDWYMEGRYTPYGEVFDIGLSCNAAIRKYMSGTPAIYCGGTREMDNGNGSLMRILPLVPYAIAMRHLMADGNVALVTQKASRITHAHERSIVGCILYVFIGMELATGERSLMACIRTGISRARPFINDTESTKYKRLTNGYDWLGHHSEDSIRSSGYVVDTLEAALWCLINSGSYEECVLKAVNLGSDTDTVAAVAGGLAAAYYGDNCIPKRWQETLAKHEDLEQMADEFDDWING